MVIISTSTEEVSIQAVSPVSIFGGGAAAGGGAAGGAAAGAARRPRRPAAGVAARRGSGVAAGGRQPAAVWAKRGAGERCPPIPAAARATPASLFNPMSFIF